MSEVQVQPQGVKGSDLRKKYREALFICPRCDAQMEGRGCRKECPRCHAVIDGCTE